MKISKAKKLINEEFSKLMGFKSGINSDWVYLCAGVKIGKITAKEAAKTVYEGIKF